jgi:hypothetical protein
LQNRNDVKAVAHEAFVKSPASYTGSMNVFGKLTTGPVGTVNMQQRHG